MNDDPHAISQACAIFRKTYAHTIHETMLKDKNLTAQLTQKANL